MKLFLEIVLSVLKLIPLVGSMIKKSELERAEKEKEWVDRDAERAEKEGRPTDEFWNKRHL